MVEEGEVDSKLTKERKRKVMDKKCHEKKKREEMVAVERRDKEKDEDVEKEDEEVEKEDESEEKEDDEVEKTEEKEQMKKKGGRPSLNPDGPMDEEELKKRRVHLNKEKRDKEKEEAKKKDISEKRAAATNSRWEGERRRKKVHTLERCREEVNSLLPSSFSSRLELLGMVASSAGDNKF